MSFLLWAVNHRHFSSSHLKCLSPHNLGESTYNPSKQSRAFMTTSCWPGVEVVAVTLFFVASGPCWILGNDWMRLSDLSCSILSILEKFLQRVNFVMSFIQCSRNTMKVGCQMLLPAKNDALKYAKKKQAPYACSVINLPRVNWGDTLFTCSMGAVRLARSHNQICNTNF